MQLCNYKAGWLSTFGIEHFRNFKEFNIFLTNRKKGLKINEVVRSIGEKISTTSDQ